MFVSSFFALLMIVAIALLHRDAISSMSSGSDSCNILVACEMGGVSDGAAGEYMGR